MFHLSSVHIIAMWFLLIYLHHFRALVVLSALILWSKYFIWDFRLFSLILHYIACWMVLTNMLFRVVWYLMFPIILNVFLFFCATCSLWYLFLLTSFPIFFPRIFQSLPNYLPFCLIMIYPRNSDCLCFKFWLDFVVLTPIYRFIIWFFWLSSFLVVSFSQTTVCFFPEIFSINWEAN